MIALARKYRPKKFSEVAVQDHVSGTMKNAIAALVIVVTWVYYGAIVFLIAGEIGQVYEQMRTRRLQTL